MGGTESEKSEKKSGRSLQMMPKGSKESPEHQAVKKIRSTFFVNRSSF